MKHLTEAEHTELLAAREERDQYARALAETPLHVLMQTLLAEVKRRGLVLTVEQMPLQPLAMGHHRTVWSTRPARGAAC